MHSKQALRQQIRTLKSTLTEERKTQATMALAKRLNTHPLFLQADTVMLYSALADEVPTQAFIDSWKDKKRLVLPVVRGADIELRLYTGSQSLAKGSFGIMEPQGEAFISYAEIPLIIVPGMAFDKEGHRLGRGKGYYDRFLSTNMAATTRKIGVCYDFQLVEHVPTEPHDIMMDEVIIV